MPEPLRLRRLLERLVESEVRFVLVGGRATNLGRVDILQGLAQVPAFDALEGEATDVEMDGLVVRVCSLGHLLEMKRASERPRDRDDLEALESTQDKTDEER